MEKLKHFKNTEIRCRQNNMTLASLEYARHEFHFRVRMFDTRTDIGEDIKLEVLSTLLCWAAGWGC